MIYDIQTTDLFTESVKNLKDRQAVMAIAKRLDRASKGHLGDVFPVGDGVSEMRLFGGPGYRLYFTQRGNHLIVLLCGDDKSSQQRDIEKARELAKTL